MVWVGLIILVIIARLAKFSRISSQKSNNAFWTRSTSRVFLNMNKEKNIFFVKLNTFIYHFLDYHIIIIIFFILYVIFEILIFKIYLFNAITFCYISYFMFLFKIWNGNKLQLKWYYTICIILRNDDKSNNPRHTLNRY